MGMEVDNHVNDLDERWDSWLGSEDDDHGVDQDEVGLDSG
jgi:hypothetical protein